MRYGLGIAVVVTNCATPARDASADERPRFRWSVHVLTTEGKAAHDVGAVPSRIPLAAQGWECSYGGAKQLALSDGTVTETADVVCSTIGGSASITTACDVGVTPQTKFSGMTLSDKKGRRLASVFLRCEAP